MIKIINGAKYSTESAKKIGLKESGKMGNSNWFRETLYRTNSGKYFLHGEGGAETKYRMHIGNNEWSDGKEIIALDRVTAKQWEKENLTGEFATVEDIKKKLVSFKISLATVRKIRTLAEEKNITQIELLEQVFKSL
jgi:hypothetical protein